MTFPQKAKFQRLNNHFFPEEEIEVIYNPTELTLEKGVEIAEIGIPGLDSPLLQFVRGQNETLSLDLFFDTTDFGMGDLVIPVTVDTDRFYQLVKIDPESHAPPICRFEWGAGFAGTFFTGQWASQARTLGFYCLVENIQQRFTLFSPEGVPLRATLTIRLREYRSLQQQIEAIRYQSPDRTRAHTIQQGQTLSQIAEVVYNDPRAWRAIAEHNHIEDPLDLVAGQILEIPPIA